MDLLIPSAPPSAVGGGGGSVLAGYRTSNLGRTSATLTADTDLTVAVEANSVYAMQLFIDTVRSGGASGITFGLTLPSGTVALGIGVTDSTTAAYLDEVSDMNAGSDYTTVITGRITTSSTAGNVVVKWGNTNATGTLTLVKGSHIILTKLN
jgi:hypothetical protein